MYKVSKYFPKLAWIGNNLWFVLNLGHYPETLVHIYMFAYLLWIIYTLKHPLSWIYMLCIYYRSIVVLFSIILRGPIVSSGSQFSQITCVFYVLRTLFLQENQAFLGNSLFWGDAQVFRYNISLEFEMILEDINLLAMKNILIFWTHICLNDTSLLIKMFPTVRIYQLWVCDILRQKSLRAIHN